MKLAIVFEVPDDPGGGVGDTAARLIEHHAFAVEQGIRHWSFDQEMRPVAAFAVPYGSALAEAARRAKAEIDQDSPWIPGDMLLDDELKPALLLMLDLLIPKA